MGWSWLRGHQAVVERFRTAIGRGRLASTFLLVGPDGVGKRSVAIELARALLCETNPEQQLEACERCPSCVQVAAGAHPDLMVVSKPENKSVLPIELFVGDRDHRMRAGLCHDISLKPSRGTRKVAIIDDADCFNQESANCLLKTLEEPPPGSTLLLIGTSEQKQLPTIRSRCQVVRFGRLSVEDLTALLLQQQLAEGDAAEALARCSEGSLSCARELASPAAHEFRQHLVQAVANPGMDCVGTIKLIQDYVEADKAEPPLKRSRMRYASGELAGYYRRLMFALCGADADADSESGAAIAQARRWWPGQETAVDCLDRCIEAELQVDANANLATWIECLVTDLARVSVSLSG